MRNRKFHFSLPAAIVSFGLILFMVYLGFWQLDRAAQKQQQQTAFQQGDTPALAADELTSMPERYQHVQVTGAFVSDTQVLMDGIPKGRRPGYLVLTPFRIEGSDRLLMVNRGWRPWTGARQSVDGLEVAPTTRQIRGRVDRFWQSGLKLGGGNAAEEGRWPRIAIYPQHAEISAWLDAPVVTWQLLLNADEPEGFLREWKPGGLGSERHVGYAVQWFALALTLFIIYLVISFRKTDATTDRE
ncbi:MAG: SURF1 family protein [Gammaproteobacteria bacterium]|nr:SURF1 family protein [Gammaproteobacteria bacterium]